MRKRIVRAAICASLVFVPIVGSTTEARADSRCNFQNHNHWHWGNAHYDNDEFAVYQDFFGGYFSVQHYRLNHGGQWQSPVTCG